VHTASEFSVPPAAPGLSRPLSILVVDDSMSQRRTLARYLRRSGFDVIEAGSGEEALDLIEADAPDIVISDWMMPGLTGIDLCRTIRTAERQRYVYFILLTSKAEKSEIVQGLEAGADDFLSKPVNSAELLGRISAGERVLKMERRLTESNRLISTTLNDMRELCDSVRRDLVEAQRLQESLIRERFRSFGSSDVSLFLRPSGHVGGDLVGFFPINARRIALFALDVAGHGIASAMMTARLSGYLSGTSPEQNLALVLSEFGIYDAHSPAEVAAMLNRIVIDEMPTEAYFTMAYADVDLVTGGARIVQAGHPHPAIQRQSGRIEFVGTGGLPIGMFDTASYSEFSVLLSPGDRLFMMSDGITEAARPDGSLLGDEGFADLLSRHRTVTGPAVFTALMDDLATGGAHEFADDVSGVLFEFRGGKVNLD
jgi:sigma-B regulation protein RsbU (phosphoserine phosphatase)